MTDKEKATIQAVIRTLDSLTLTGRENMGKVLGCMNALEEMLDAGAKEEAKCAKSAKASKTTAEAACSAAEGPVRKVETYG